VSHLLVFGYGGVGAATGALLLRQGWSVDTTARTPNEAARVAALGAAPVDPADPSALAAAVATSDAVLITAPPGESGCPGLAALAPALLATRHAPWLGYLSTTGVYGDHGGGWVFEQTPPTPASDEARRRLQAETAWQALAADLAAPGAVFRLPGLYGPGRSALDRLRAGDARRIVRPGQLFSRLHLDDAAAAIAAAIARPSAGAVFNLCDDEPAPNADVIAYAAGLLNLPVPPEEPYDPATASPAGRRFWSESKRVSNAQAKAALAWRPAYPTYREGLRALLLPREAQRNAGGGPLR
jgi:nucleoside-diphosphate-sugar epimerase